MLPRGFIVVLVSFGQITSSSAFSLPASNANDNDTID
jgi:hypothetical protein